MSWTDEEIDNLFQEGAKTQSFEYKDAYFSEVEAMLPVNKKGKDFLWMGTALLFIAALTTGYFVNNTGENTFGGSNDQLANVEVNSEINTTTNKTNKKATSDSNASSEDQQSLTGNSESNDQLSNANLTSNNSVNRGSENLNSTNGSTNGSMNGFTNQNGVANQIGNQNGINASNSLKSLGNGARIKTSSQLSSNDGSPLGTSGAKAPKGQLIDLRSGTEIFEQKESQTTSSPITAGLNLNEANQLNQGLDRSLTENKLSMPVLGELRPKSAFYFELNAGMSQSLVTPEEYTSTSYGGGFGVETHLGNFNLTTGLNFKLSVHNDLSLTRSGKLYGFGSKSATDNFDYKNVSSIELPISLGYSVGNHNFNVGVRSSMLIGAKIKYKSFENEELTRSEEVTALAGDMRYFGLKRLGLKPTVGYSYHMNKWTIGANVGVQLLQSVNEEYINGFNNRFPIDGQVYLRRTIRLRK